MSGLTVPRLMVDLCAPTSETEIGSAILRLVVWLLTLWCPGPLPMARPFFFAKENHREAAYLYSYQECLRQHCARRCIRDRGRCAAAFSY